MRYILLWSIIIVSFFGFMFLVDYEHPDPGLDIFLSFVGIVGQFVLAGISLYFYYYKPKEIQNPKCEGEKNERTEEQV